MTCIYHQFKKINKTCFVPIKKFLKLVLEKFTVLKIILGKKILKFLKFQNVSFQNCSNIELGIKKEPTKAIKSKNKNVDINLKKTNCMDSSYIQSVCIHWDLKNQSD